ncbi:MAG TPA: hypothetical protein VIR31_07420, partial [Nitrososphaeraceae archaeon]
FILWIWIWRKRFNSHVIVTNRTKCNRTYKLRTIRELGKNTIKVSIYKYASILSIYLVDVITRSLPD